jgi:D-xylose transport system ATP-binding protein
MAHISKHFGGVYAVNDVSFDLYRGEVLAVVGDNGAGKSTLIKILSGAYVADGGEIYVDGREVRIESPADSRRLGIEVIYQNLALLDNLDVPANIFMGRELTKPRSFGLMDLKAMRRKAIHLLEGFEVDLGDIGREVRNLSGGQRQMVAISRAIYFEAQVIILDEPTAALGVAETKKVYEFIDRLRDNNLAVVIISHNINEVEHVADRFMVLKTGSLVGIKRKEETSVDDIVSMIISGRARNGSSQHKDQTHGGT